VMLKKFDAYVGESNEHGNQKKASDPLPPPLPGHNSRQDNESRASLNIKDMFLTNSNAVN
jgi:hypothetical protein